LGISSSIPPAIRNDIADGKATAYSLPHIHGRIDRESYPKKAERGGNNKDWIPAHTLS
jgi:hypothetical protein